MKKLIIVDISSFIFRAFYAIRVLHAPDGTPVNAVHGVLSMLLKLFAEYKPTHLLMARDGRETNFREILYPQYKANRSAPPDDLIPQFALIEELMEKMQLPSCLLPQYEADDVIGSAVTQWQNQFEEILIVSGDKDLMQFINDKVHLLDTMKDKIIGPNDVKEKMGVMPNQVVDFLSMVGDSSDNIPGVKGIGEKGAAKLLQEYETLEECLKQADKISNKKIANGLAQYREDAILSKKLVQIPTDLDLKISPEATAFTFYPNDELISFLQGLGMKNAILKLQELKKNEMQIKKEPAVNVFLESVTKNNNLFEKHQLIIIDNSDKLNELKIVFRSHDQIAFWPKYETEANYLEKVSSILTNFGDDKIYEVRELPQSQMCEFLSFMWGHPEKKIISPDWKQDHHFAFHWNINVLCQTVDVLLAYYIVNSEGRNSLDSLLDINSDQKVIQLFQTGKELMQKLITLELEPIYWGIDAKLIPVLAKMEYHGISINPPFLKQLENEFNSTLSSIEEEISNTTGETINLKSPKQVADLLFNKLKLPVIKENKTGPSTDSEVLEELSTLDQSPIPDLILKYRELEKLLSTYIRTLPELVSEKTKRIHTTFNQHIAATGRLSSTNPNIQNIPVRSENGRRIRKAFIATPGKILLSADYSQIELRILAHFSQDPKLCAAFERGDDVHAQTAAEIMGTTVDKVTREERGWAKAVNFGLMYGQSSFGLSKELHISRNMAKEYIEKYFNNFSKVKIFLDSVKEFCEANGFVKTLHGRKRFLPDIKASNRNLKAMAERMAINSPIQGTAADMIKLAMIEIDKKIQEHKLASKMLLQVHDELIFELPEEELPTLREIVRSEMENAITLKVPIKVDIRLGVNWYDLK